MFHIATRLAEAKRSDEALKLLKDFSGDEYKQNENYKMKALSNIASFTAVNGDEQKAFRIIDRITDEEFKEEAVSDMAIAYAKAGDLDKAGGIMKTMKSSNYKINALIEMTKACVEKGKIDQAKKAASAIESDNSYVKIRTMMPVARGVSRAGRHAEAKEILRQAIRRSYEIDFEFTFPLAMYLILNEFTERAAPYNELLHAAQTIPDDSDRLEVLATILFHMGFYPIFPQVLGDDPGKALKF